MLGREQESKTGLFYLLPLLIKIIINSSIGDCHHDNKDAKQNNTNQELIRGPHWNGCRLQITVNVIYRKK